MPEEPCIKHLISAHRQFRVAFRLRGARPETSWEQQATRRSSAPRGWLTSAAKRVPKTSVLGTSAAPESMFQIWILGFGHKFLHAIQAPRCMFSSTYGLRECA